MVDVGDTYESDEDIFMSPKKIKGKTLLVPNLPLVGVKQRKVDAIRSLLTGVPPPPDVTNPTYNLDFILDKWNGNQNFVWSQNPDKKDLNEFNNELGICLNVDLSCEEFEELCPNFCSRFIWSETFCWTGAVYVKLTNSAKKRKRANGWAVSPKTRMNYLSRRRSTFRALSPRKTFVFIKDDKKSSTSKSSGPLLRPKRALFQSPEEKDMKFKTPECGRSDPRLNSAATFSPKRTNNPLTSSEKRKCSRSLFDSKPRKLADSLSKAHRQKLLWAVSNALREEGVSSKDGDFKLKASSLFKSTLEIWNRKETKRNSDNRESTSDSMLVIARNVLKDQNGMNEMEISRLSPENSCLSLVRVDKTSTSNEKKNEISNIKTPVKINLSPLKLETIGETAMKENQTPSKKRKRETPKKDFTPLKSPFKKKLKLLDTFID